MSSCWKAGAFLLIYSEGSAIMITSIDKIQGVGRYEKMDKAVTLHKSQVIFGFNGSGKSTLSDIFYSLNGDNYLKLITDRKTLPKEDGKMPEEAEIVFSTDTTELIFKEGKWNRKEDVLVFNDQYIEEYITIGENYTSDGRAVSFGKREKQLAEEISKLSIANNAMLEEINVILVNNKSICEKIGLGKSRITSSNWGKRINNISNVVFCKAAEKDAEWNIIENEKKHDTRLKKIEEWITSLKNSPILFDLSKIKEIKELKDLLVLTPRITSKEILEHIEHSMKNKDINWLLRGKNYQKDSRICPFCGQEIKNRDFIKVSQKLEKYINSRQKEKADNITTIMRKIVSFFDEEMLVYFFNALSNVYEQNKVDTILRKPTVNLIEQLLISYNLEPGCFDSLYKKINDKISNPYLEIYLTEDENSLYKALLRVIQKINKLIGFLQDDYNRIESKISASKDYEKRVALFEASFGSNCENFRRMVDLAKQMLANEKKMEAYQKEIDKLVEQNRLDPVNSFLEELNVNFKVSIKDNRYYVQIKGYEPHTYEKENKILCSEGERRMLAFAYFLQEVNAISQKKIIVVDDPISSLDLNRKSVVAYKIVDLMKSMDNQVIVLSHDVAFIEKIDSLSKSLKPELNMLELHKGEELFGDLHLQEYLVSDESVYEKIIHTGETSVDINDKIVALMALRPYAYLKTRGAADGDNAYSVIELNSTYFAHSTYSHNKKQKYTKGRYSTRLLRAYCNKVSKATRKALNVNSLVPENYTFKGFDYQTAWELYEAIPIDSIYSLRKKALVLRVVLETTLFMLTDKKSFDYERIGDAYNGAYNKAKQVTRNKSVQELNDNIQKLYKLYNFSKKYHHGAEGGSTLGLSSLNAEEMLQFDREIHEIHDWIFRHPDKCNKYAVSKASV